MFSITKRQSIFLFIVSPNRNIPSDHKGCFISTIETELILLLTSVCGVKFLWTEYRNKNVEIKIALFLEFVTDRVDGSLIVLN